MGSKRDRRHNEAAAEILSEFDHLTMQMNQVLRTAREACMKNRCHQPLTQLLIDTEHITAQFDSPTVRYSRLIRDFGRAVDRLADTFDACEHGHPGDQCMPAKVAIMQLVLPMLVSCSSVASGVELARGKVMQIGEVK